MSEMLQRKPTPLWARHLVESTDPDTDRVITVQEKIFTAVADLDALGWRGVVAFPNGQCVIEFNSKTDPTLPPVRPALGDWLVLDIGLLRTFTDVDCAANYDEVEG